MQIERLVYFREIAQAGSIKRASENINISQQALSQSMMAMEKELGVTLLRRGRKGIVLTEAGKQVLPVAEEIGELWVGLKNQLAQKPLARERLSLGIAPYVEKSYYAEILNYMRFEQPDCQLQVVNVYHWEAARLLARGEIELAVVSIRADEIERLLAAHEQLRLIELMEIKVDVLVNRNSELAGCSRVSFEQLKPYPVAVERIDDYQREFFWGRELLEQQLNFISVCSVHTAQEMVAKNLAISFAARTDSIFKEYKDHIQKIELDTGGRLGVVGILLKEGSEDDAVIKSLVELLCEM